VVVTARWKSNGWRPPSTRAWFASSRFVMKEVKLEASFACSPPSTGLVHDEEDVGARDVRERHPLRAGLDEAVADRLKL